MLSLSDKFKAIAVEEKDLVEFCSFLSKNVEGDVPKIEIFKRRLNEGSKFYFVQNQEGVKVGTFGIQPKPNLSKRLRSAIKRPFSVVFPPRFFPLLGQVSVAHEFRAKQKGLGGRAALRIIRLAEEEAKKMGIKKLYANIFSGNLNWRQDGQRRAKGVLGYKVDKLRTLRVMINKRVNAAKDVIIKRKKSVVRASSVMSKRI